MNSTPQKSTKIPKLNDQNFSFMKLYQIKFTVCFPSGLFPGIWIQTMGYNPEKSTQHSEHGESFEIKNL